MASLVVVILAAVSGIGQAGWMRLVSPAVGGTLAATALTLSGAMAGLAAGAWLAGRFRVGLRPVALLCALMPAVVPWLASGLTGLDGHPSARLLLAALLLAVAHVPAGALVPAACANGRSAGTLWALGALGTLFGIAAAGLWLHEVWALDHVGLGAAAVGLAACLFAKGRGAEPAHSAEPVPARSLALAFGLGFLGLLAESLWTCILGFHWEASPRCFAWVAAAHVGGAAAGAFLASWGRVRLTWALAGAAFCLASAAVLSSGAGGAVSSSARMATAAAMVGIPAAFMGAAFVALLGSASPRTLGLLSAANAAGSALGPLFLWIASPWLGWPPLVLLAVACGYALLGRPRVAAAALAAGGWLLLPSGPRAQDLFPHEVSSEADFGATVLPFVRSGPGATVAVTRDTQLGTDVLWIDRGVQGDTSPAGRLIPRRLGRLPCELLGRPPDRAMLIGLGTGMTLAGMQEGGARRVEIAELCPGVIEAAGTVFAEANGRALEREGVRVRRADGRTMLADVHEPCDLIVADMVFPSVAGAGSLFSREFYALARRRLAPGGVFVHWVPCLQLDPEDVSRVAAAFLESFPEGSAWIGTLDAGRVVLGLAGGALAPRDLRHRALGPAELRALAGTAEAARDADARIEYRSARPREGAFAERNLRRLLDHMSAGPWADHGEGSLEESRGNLARAMELYRRAAADCPDAARSLERLEFARALERARAAASRGDERGMIESLRRAASHGSFVGGNVQLGDLLASRGFYAEALREFECAAGKAPRSADIRLKSAFLAAALGDFGRARESFTQARSLRPDRPLAFDRFERELARASP